MAVEFDMTVHHAPVVIGFDKEKPRCGWTFAPRLPETKPAGKPAPLILSEKALHYYDV